MLPALAFAIIPGVILTQILTKHYIVGTCGHTLVIAQFSPKWRSLAVAVKSACAIPFAELRGQSVNVKSGTIHTTIAFGQDDAGIKAKFHRAFSKINRCEAEAIGEAILAASGS